MSHIKYEAKAAKQHHSFTRLLWFVGVIIVLSLWSSLASAPPAIAQSNAEAEYWFNNGHDKAARGDLDGAIANYNRALELNPNYALAYNARDNAKSDKGDLDGAIADCTRAIELDPKYARFYNTRGWIKSKKGDLDGAIADYNRAIELDPKYALAYNNRGLAKGEKGDLDGANADYSRAIELDPKLAFPYVNRGSAKIDKGDLDGAIVDYSRAIELEPKDADNYKSLAILHYAKYQFADALKDIRRSLELNPKDDDYLRLSLFLTRSRLGEKAAAAQELSSYCATRKSGEGDDWGGALLAYILGRRPEKALLDLAKAGKNDQERHERFCEAHFYIGSMKLLAGDKAQAAAHFRAVLDTGVLKFNEFALARAELAVLNKGR